MKTADYACVSRYVAAALSLVVGSQVSLGDKRGPPRADRFELTDVPEHVDLSEIPYSVAQYSSIDRCMVESSASRGKNEHAATMFAGGRGRMPHSSITVSRDGTRVLVDIVRFPS